MIEEILHVNREVFEDIYHCRVSVVYLPPEYILSLNGVGSITFINGKDKTTKEVVSVKIKTIKDVEHCAVTIKIINFRELDTFWMSHSKEKEPKDIRYLPEEPGVTFTNPENNAFNSAVGIN